MFLKRDAGGGFYKASMIFELGALKEAPCLAKSKIICEGCGKKISIRNGGMLQQSDVGAQISRSFFVRILLSTILA